jgi:DNA-binding MurR/RpiR family transcriptional regulator
MDTAHDLTVAERVRSLFDELTRAEKQLANALLENYPVSGLGSITILAEASGVSTPTVVRMAKKLGFKGFPELQAALRSELEATISNPIAKHDRWAENAPDTHILNRFADAVMDNLRQTLRQMDPQGFTAVTAILLHSHAGHPLGADPGRPQCQHLAALRA